MMAKHVPTIESEKQRFEWFNVHLGPETETTEVFDLIAEAARRFQSPKEDREARFVRVRAMPEFVL